MHLQHAQEALLAWSPLYDVFERRAQRRLTVLAYHAVDDAEGFRRQMQCLKASRPVVSAAELESALAGHARLPEGATLVTFDDGYRSVYTAGLPTLKALGLPALLFVVAGLIDSDTPFWWEEVEALFAAGASVPELPDARTAVRQLKKVPDVERRHMISRLRDALHGSFEFRMPQLSTAEVRELERGGIAIGSHTYSHPCLDKCTDPDVERELEDAHERITSILGHPPASFAYPNGNWDLRAERRLHALGYRSAFLFDNRLALPCPTNPLRISRVCTDTRSTLHGFRLAVSGLGPALSALRKGASRLERG